MTPADADEAALLGACWAIPGCATHVLRAWDGCAVRVKGGRLVRPVRATWTPGGSWVLGLPGRRRGLAAVYEGALGLPRGCLRLAFPRDADGPTWADVWAALPAGVDLLPPIT